MFLKGRCILKNVALAEELIFSINNGKLPGYILKVDFAKAFDHVDWDFLFNLLKVRGFGNRWVGWIKSIMYSSKANILINGSSNGYIRYNRGLQQGDPLSPLLFILVTNVLSAMFTHALKSRVLVGIPFGNLESQYNLHYVNDLLILTMGGLDDLRIVKMLLMIFEGMIGLETNFSKTCFFSSKWGNLPAKEAAENLRCQVGMLPITYLGISILGCRPQRQDWEGIILKVRKRLVSWKGRFLSLGVKLTLINLVLSALLTYWMSIFCLPAWVIKKIDQIRRDFLWSGMEIDNPVCHLVS